MTGHRIAALLLGSAALAPAMAQAQIGAAAQDQAPPTAPQAPPQVPAPATGTDAVARAQGADGAQGGDAAADAAAAEGKAADVVVTGSRIARPEFKAPNPIISFNSANIAQSGDTNLTNFLERVPALTGSRDFTQTSGGNAVYGQNFGAAGLNQLNLRNLGTNRTLVLVDGRRHVAGSDQNAAVDINSIPTDLVERVDVLTAGASAVYGADGVSGVVNFILKRDFDGIVADAQLGVSARNDAGSQFASIAAGRNFADGRGNVTLAYEFEGDEPLANEDRTYLGFSQRRYLIPNPNPGVGALGKYSNVLVGQLRYGGESPIGAVFVGAENNPSYNGLGQPYVAGAPASYYTTGAVSDDTPVAGFYSGDLAPRIRRHNVNLLTHYDFSDAFKLSVDAKFSQVSATTFDYYNAIYYTPIALDNPYLPSSIRNAALMAGTTDIHVNRDDLDYGRHGENDIRRTYRGVVDVSGRISAHARYDAYYTYGETDTAINKQREILGDRYLQAIDAVSLNGQIVCRSAAARAAGCLPVSLFGPGPTSQAALNYFQVNDTSRTKVTQSVANASISGDFGQFFSLPGGPVQFSIGGEYRRESSRFDPSANFLSGAFLSYNEATVVPVSGGAFDVKEAFGELNAPVFDGARFAYTLSVGAAYRFSHYSTSGDTNTWQVNGIWAPVRDVSFRGSYGYAVRAPNTQELFQPTSAITNFIVDPCTPGELGHGTQYRAANCQALLARYGAVISDSLQTPNNVAGITSGNVGLKPESARTWTAGVVLRPRFVPGLTVSADWYDIKLNDAINVASPGQLPGLCVDQPTIDNQFCAVVTRQQGTGRVIGYVTEPQNVANFQTAGLDVNLDYLLRTKRLGTFDIRLVGGYLNRLLLIPLPGATPIDRVDQFGAPRFNANFSPTWTIGKLTLNYNLRWFDKTRVVDKQTTDSDPNYAPPAQLRYSALWQSDAQALLRVDDRFSVYVGGTNLSDQKPDPGNSINAPIAATGRYLYVGARINLKRAK